MSDDKKEVKFDLSSTAIEKGIDAARSFVDKLVAPSIEELGLLLRDQVSLWRFGNQVKILNKAKALCERHDVSVKAISPKLLCPYLEHASLEDDEQLQDKWAALLMNMVDSRQNVQNHVFPYILSQLSRTEFNLVESAALEKKDRRAKMTVQLEEYRQTKSQIELELRTKIEELSTEATALRVRPVGPSPEQATNIYVERGHLQRRLGDHLRKEYWFRCQLGMSQIVGSDEAQEFEMANIVRLGLAQVVYEASAQQQSIDVPRREYDSHEKVQFEVEIDTESSTVLTQLGELFIEACQERNV